MHCNRRKYTKDIKYLQQDIKEREVNMICEREFTSNSDPNKKKFKFTF